MVRQVKGLPCTPISNGKVRGHHNRTNAGLLACRKPKEKRKVPPNKGFSKMSEERRKHPAGKNGVKDPRGMRERYTLGTQDKRESEKASMGKTSLLRPVAACGVFEEGKNRCEDEKKGLTSRLAISEKGHGKGWSRDGFTWHKTKQEKEKPEKK